jgi:hypothetical protein
MTNFAMKKVLCIGTAGKGGQDELRMQRLTNRLEAEIAFHHVDKSQSKLTEARKVWHLLRAEPWDLVYQEGTGIAGGINLILAALMRNQAFIVSSGDPIAGFFRTTKGPLIGLLFELYERLLHRTCAGFVGWTPYLTGVAIRQGAKQAITVEGAVDTKIFYPYFQPQRLELRQKYGLPANHLVCGVVGSLIWVPTQSYCYGYELVEILKRLERQDVSLLIVGDGDGRTRLEQAIPPALKSRAVFTGRISEAEVVETMNIMDIGFVTLFGEMGNYRLTTKLPEYLACGVPVAMNPTAGFYDYAAEAGWALPKGHPASPEFHQRCAAWIDQLTWNEVKDKTEHTLKVVDKYFDYEVVGPKFRNFVNDLLA